MSDDPALRRTITRLTGEAVAEVQQLREGPRATTYRADGRWLVKRYRERTAFSDHEIAAYEQLQGSAVTPALVGADGELPLLVTEYLADGVDFMGAFGRRGELGALMARLVTATQDWEDEPAARQEEAEALIAAWPRGMRFCGDVGVAAPPLPSSLIEAFVEPPVVWLTQGDPAPSNVMFVEGSAFLVDFEYAAMRAGLFDLAQWFVRIPLPVAWQEDLQAPVRAVYPGDFDRDLAAMQVWAAAYMLTWLPLDGILLANRDWAEGWTVREALISTGARGADAAERAGFSELRDFFRAFHRTLAVRWPECGDGSPRLFSAG